MPNTNSVTPDMRFSNLSILWGWCVRFWPCFGGAFSYGPTAINCWPPVGGPYHLRQRSQHEYAKPPATMPAEMPKPSPDNQASIAPIIPPTVMLASNQKIQLAKFRTTAIRPPEGVAAQTRGGTLLGENRQSRGYKLHNRLVELRKSTTRQITLCTRKGPISGGQKQSRPPTWAASISPNGHFSFAPENDRLMLARTQMSAAPVSSPAPQPRDRGHFYNGSWPFREGKDGPPTRIFSNCCNRVTPPASPPSTASHPVRTAPRRS